MHDCDHILNCDITSRLVKTDGPKLGIATTKPKKAVPPITGNSLTGTKCGLLSTIVMELPLYLP